MIHLKIDLLIQGDPNHTETKSLCINNSSQNYLSKAVLVAQLVYFTLRIAQILFE